MPRRKAAVKRDILPDPKHGSTDLAKFINIIMRHGKKSIAEKIVYGALEEIEKKQKSDPVAILNKALSNVTPRLELKARRVGGATYQVPLEVSHDRGLALARRWLAQYARDRHEKTMAERLANEILDAFQGRGNAVKKRDDVHRMADANKAFAHFNWN